MVERWVTSGDRTDEDRLCFVLNLCNLMTLHGMVVLGAPSTSVGGLLGRAVFNPSVKYNVGSLVFDLVQAEHSLLRAGLTNARFSYGMSLGSPSRPFRYCGTRSAS